MRDDVYLLYKDVSHWLGASPNQALWSSLGYVYKSVHNFWMEPAWKNNLICNNTGYHNCNMMKDTGHNAGVFYTIIVFLFPEAKTEIIFQHYRSLSLLTTDKTSFGQLMRCYTVPRASNYGWRGSSPWYCFYEYHNFRYCFCYGIANSCNASPEIAVTWRSRLACFNWMNWEKKPDSFITAIRVGDIVIPWMIIS